MNITTNSEFQIYTATQSSTIGWKEISCSKVVSSNYNDVATVRLAIASGNPEIFFTTSHEQVVMRNNTEAYRSINFTKGWRCNTGGTIDNPTGNGACDFVAWQLAWNDGCMDWGYWNLGTRYIDFKINSGCAAPVTSVITVLVYSERKDLITLSCL